MRDGVVHSPPNDVLSGSGDYGNQKNPPDLGITPEQWIAEEKLMPGALRGYTYVEDLRP